MPPNNNRLPGICNDDEAYQTFFDRYAEKDREQLCMGNLTDFALANEQFMVMRDDMKLSLYQTAAKDRIRWLAIQMNAAAGIAKNLLDAAKAVLDLVENETIDQNPNNTDDQEAAVGKAFAQLALAVKAVEG